MTQNNQEKLEQIKKIFIYGVSFKEEMELINITENFLAERKKICKQWVKNNQKVS